MERVFPAYAGVFLNSQMYLNPATRLPRIRGGVSDEPFEIDVVD